MGPLRTRRGDQGAAACEVEANALALARAGAGPRHAADHHYQRGPGGTSGQPDAGGGPATLTETSSRGTSEPASSGIGGPSEVIAETEIACNVRSCPARPVESGVPSWPSWPAARWR